MLSGAHKTKEPPTAFELYWPIYGAGEYPLKLFIDPQPYKLCQIWAKTLAPPALLVFIKLRMGGGGGVGRAELAVVCMFCVATILCYCVLL